MGQDYSYTQPSSSSEDYDITSQLQAEADLYAEEGQSNYKIPEAVRYISQHESDDGIPTICYCGGEPIVATSYTAKDPGRRYYTCRNVDIGDCHIWKWWDLAVMEELRDYQKQLRQVKDERNQSEQKLVVVQKTVSELSKKVTGVKLMLCVLVLIGLVLFFVRGIASKDSYDSLHQLSLK